MAVCTCNRLRQVSFLRILPWLHPLRCFVLQLALLAVRVISYAPRLVSARSVKLVKRFVAGAACAQFRACKPDSMV